MSKVLVSAGACAVPPGEMVFARDRRSGDVFPVCPDCGCAFPDFPQPPMTIEDYRSIEQVCPEGIETASLDDVRTTGLGDQVFRIVSEEDFGFNLEIFVISGDTDSLFPE